VPRNVLGCHFGWIGDVFCLSKGIRREAGSLRFTCGILLFVCAQIAMGIPLYRIKDIRVLYGEEPWADSVIDFISPHNKPLPKGHVIATRITSENPDEVSLSVSLSSSRQWHKNVSVNFLTNG